MGSAVDRAGLTDALQKLSNAGLGGVEICPIYGAVGAEHRFVKFLSADWVELLKHTVDEADRLGMRVDLTTGTGWPFGGPNVTAQEASCKLVLARFDVEGGQQLEKALPGGVVEHAVAVDSLFATVDVSDKIADGHIRWTAPAGAGWQVLVALRVGPIQKVKRAAPGGEGNVVDPYSTAALEHYLSAFDEAFPKAGWPKLHAQFHDSFEYFDADWTPALLGEFANRRGYDLRSQLPALAGLGPVEQANRVRCDYRQTIAELHLEYIVRWMEWSHSKGCLAREQAHGAPANPIDVYAATDIPETEVFGPLDENSLLMNKLASSAAHLARRPVASSESFTWLGEHFQVTLADAKAEADYLFLSGINRLVFHGTAYSPGDVAWPGWLFYASTHFEPNCGLWRDLPAFCGYLARCQSVLHSGQPSRDVLLYFPVYDFWQTMTVEKEMLVPFAMHPDRLMTHPLHAVGMALWQGGYLFDQVSDHFVSVARVIDGQIEIGGVRYATIVVPSCRVMPVETLKSLLDLAKGGATVIFLGLPDDVPGFLNVEPRRDLLKHLLKEIDAGAAGGVVSIGSGRVIVGSSLVKMLEGAGIIREPLADAGLRCERREHEDGHSYFIVNRGTVPFDGWVSLGKAAQGAVLLDPRFESRTGRAAMRQRDNRAECYLQLLPGESVILQTFMQVEVTATPWRYEISAGKPIAIEGPWHVEFIEGGPTLPAAFESDHLGSWTETANPEAKRFAGTARYKIEFQKPNGLTGTDDCWLDLGRVCETARVHVNGHAAGIAWSEPYRLPIGQWLAAGPNVIEVEVTNLAANRIADLDRMGVPWKRFHEINFVNKDYKPFDASGWPLRESGWIGPVRLLPTRRLMPA